MLLCTGNSYSYSSACSGTPKCPSRTFTTECIRAYAASADVQYTQLCRMLFLHLASASCFVSVSTCCCFVVCTVDRFDGLSGALPNGMPRMDVPAEVLDSIRTNKVCFEASLPGSRQHHHYMLGCSAFNQTQQHSCNKLSAPTGGSSCAAVISRFTAAQTRSQSEQSRRVIRQSCTAWEIGNAHAAARSCCNTNTAARV